MKRSRLLILILLLILIVVGFFYSKSFLKKKTPTKPPVSEVTPLPTEILQPSPETQPGPGAVPPGAEVVPPPETAPSEVTAIPKTAPPAEAVPRAESLPTESQPVIQLSVGESIKIAEGTTLILEKAAVTYAGKSPLDYLWKVTSGPAELIDIPNPNELNARVIIKNIEQPTEFILHLSATDQKTEATADLRISAFPAKFTWIQKVGGAFVGVEHMGDKWVAARGNSIEIFDVTMTPLAKVMLDHPIAQFFSEKSGSGKGAVYVQAPEGEWSVVQADPVMGSKISGLPMLGKNIRRIVPFELDQAPYMFALLERSIDLWNLTDVTHPRLKTSLGKFLKNPLYLTFFQRNIYVAEEEAIHVIDFATGNLLASVPSGGSITGLGTYSLDGKNYLLASIGKDRTIQGRKDHGLRIFEISANGTLGSERRFALNGNVAVEKALVITGVDKALLSVRTEKGLGFRAVDLKQLKEIPLDLPSSINFLVLSDFETGKINDSPVVVVADGNQIRVLAFKAVGDPPQQYTVSEQKSIPGIITASWIKASSDGARIWVGDSGTIAGGALSLIDGQSLNIVQTFDAPAGSFPVDADFSSGSSHNPILYIAEEPKNIPEKSHEGFLGLISNDSKASPAVETSPGLFGINSPQGMLRPLGIASRIVAESLRIVVAISRTSGNIGGSGLALLEKNKAQTNFLQSEAAKTLTLIPFQDARDVALSQDGKVAFVAGGVEGLIAVDLEKKTPVARMSLGSNEWVADRVLLGHRGDLVLAAFVKPATRQVLLKIFGISQGTQMQEYGTIADLSTVMTILGSRAPQFALTQDDLYLFMPTQESHVSVFNLTNPTEPLKILETQVPGEIRGVALANKFKDVFLALGPAGVGKLEFGF